jgi:hypothetical protein
MTRDFSPMEAAGVAAITVFGFLLGWATPLGTILVALFVAALLFDMIMGGGDMTQAAGSTIAGLWRRALTPIDLTGASPARRWLWRAPALATLIGFLLRWSANLMGVA